MEVFSRVMEILAAVVVLFLYPVMSMAQKQAEAEEVILRIRTVQFADRIRTHGYLSEEEYEKFWKQYQSFTITGEIKLETTGLRYDEGNDISYHSIVTHEEIMEQLRNVGIVIFCQGDSLTVTVEGEFAGVTGMIKRIYGVQRLSIQAGGLIRDEIEPVYAVVP